LGQGIIWLGDSFGRNSVARAGQPLRMDNEFVAIRPNTHDNVVSSSLIGYAPDDATWAWVAQDDGIPALGAIPTLKWIGGSAVDDLRYVMVSDEAYTDQRVSGALILYDAFTNRPLNILDEGIVSAGPAIPLGNVTIK
jgi:hypothetical protein